MLDCISCFKFVICLRSSKPYLPCQESTLWISHNTCFRTSGGRNLCRSESCFGYGIKKFNKAIQDKLRDLDYQIVQSLAYSMSGDDQRRIAFCSTHNNVFANSFPLTLAPDPSLRFSLPEFTVAMARKFGAPIPQLLPYVGTTVRSEGRSQKVRVWSIR